MEETSVKGIASTARNKSAIARFKTKTFVLVCRQVKRYKDVKIREFPNTAARIIKPKMVASKHTVTKERGSPSVVACVDVLTSCKISIFSTFHFPLALRTYTKTRRRESAISQRLHPILVFFFATVCHEVQAEKRTVHPLETDGRH